MCNACSGEMQLEYYAPLTRAVEWFMRCRTCGLIGPVAATGDDALKSWRVRFNN